MLTLDSPVYIGEQAGSMDVDHLDRIRYRRIAYNVLKKHQAFILSLSAAALYYSACYGSTTLMGL